jgi:hypothetical protein
MRQLVLVRRIKLSSGAEPICRRDETMRHPRKASLGAHSKQMICNGWHWGVLANLQLALVDQEPNSL